MTDALARQLDFTKEQLALIKGTLAIDFNGQPASDMELKYLLEVAKLRNLNPLTKQVYFIKIQGRWTFQVSIDGLRAIAQRSGVYGGQDEPVFKYDAKGNLLSCSVSVWRKDWQRPVVGVAFFKEFVQAPKNGKDGLWQLKPHVMISKVAEAIALRKAFSEEMSGLYAPEEFDAAQQIPQVAAGASDRTRGQEVSIPPPADFSGQQQAAHLAYRLGDSTGEVIDVEPIDSPPDDVDQTVEEVARVPFGKKQGIAVTDLTDKDLSWYYTAAEKSIIDPGKHAFKEKNQAWRDAVLNEIDRRTK